METISLSRWKMNFSAMIKGEQSAKSECVVMRMRFDAFDALLAPMAAQNLPSEANIFADILGLMKTSISLFAIICSAKQNVARNHLLQCLSTPLPSIQKVARFVDALISCLFRPRRYMQSILS